MAAAEREGTVPTIVVVPSIIDDIYQKLALQVMATTFVGLDIKCRIVLRSTLRPIACKTSAIIYIIMCILIANGRMKPPTILHIKDSDLISQTINSIKSTQSSVLRMLLNNAIDPGPDKLVLNYDVANPDYLRSKNIFFMVLFNISEVGIDVHSFRNGNISHYFVIVQRDGKFYLISSYGSAICSPQQEVELDLKEWATFVHDFTNKDSEEKRNNESMQAKLREYFLPNKDTTLFLPGEDDMVYVSVESAIQADVDFYIQCEHEIICIDNIVDLVVPFIPPKVTYGGKTKKKSKKRRRTRKKDLIMNVRHINWNE